MRKVDCEHESMAWGELLGDDRPGEAPSATPWEVWVTARSPWIPRKKLEARACSVLAGRFLNLSVPSHL